MTYLLAFDQGTSSTRSIVFDVSGQVLGAAQQGFAQIYPQPGRVEHNATEIWQTQRDTARQALQQAGISANRIAAVGLTNQRETTVIWDRETGTPYHNAIVWQDRRTEPLCQALRDQGMESVIRQRTGLRIDPYFSATKLKWLLDHIPDARQRAEQGRLAFGTIDSWLIWQATGGQQHVTDVSNAARTMLFNIHTNQWDSTLLDALDIPTSVLPKVLPSAAHFGDLHPDVLGLPIPIMGVAGDQQSALFGQACFEPGMAKNTYGTGCFMLMNTGESFNLSEYGLITTATAQTSATPEYALEGSVFVAGAVVQWLRDELNAVRKSHEIETLALTVPDSGGVMFVPAFTGLGAPWWEPDARGTITGITRGTTLAHIARAALESIAFQSASVLEAMSQDAIANGAEPLRELRVDGGASVNDFLMQFQADLLGIPVIRPTNVETTALGAAWLAGLGVSIYSDRQELAHHWRPERIFHPALSRDEAGERMAQWDRAIRQTRNL